MSDRERIRAGLDAVIRGRDDGESIIADDAVFHIAAPIGKLVGRAAIRDDWFATLRNSFDGVHRRDIIALESRDYLAPDENWLAISTAYVGNFNVAFCGVAPSRSVAFFRAGEFYRIRDGRIVEARIIFDLPDLMQQTGITPFPRTYGLQRNFPAPATQDGLTPSVGNSDESRDVMARMLRDLIAFDPDTKTSAGMTGEGGAWHDDFLWYGPAGIGATYRWDGFVKDHRAPFLDAFPDRDKGETVCHLGDHNYAAICGHGMPMRHEGDYFTLAASGTSVLLPVMDFYRVQDGRLIENWVYLDYVDMFSQLGVDIVAGTGWPT